MGDHSKDYLEHKEIKDELKLINQKLDNVIIRMADKQERTSEQLGGIRSYLVLLYAIVMAAVGAVINFYIKS